MDDAILLAKPQARERDMSYRGVSLLIAFVVCLSFHGAISGETAKGAGCKPDKNKGCVARTGGGKASPQTVGAAKVKSHSNTNNN